MDAFLVSMVADYVVYISRYIYDHPIVLKYSHTPALRELAEGRGALSRGDPTALHQAEITSVL